MVVWVFDKNFIAQGIIDTFKSLLWVTRYDDFGDFELYMSMDAHKLDIMKEGYYLWLSSGDNEYMIIEEIQVKTNIEDGNDLVIVGRTLDTILARRIIWTQTIIKGNLQDGIEQLLNDNAINPEDSKRKIPNLIFKKSTDERITKLECDTQFTGDNLYDAIRSLCSSNNISFRITLSDEFNFIFELYAGDDYSYKQNNNPYITFSKKYGNLLNTSYLTSTVPLKTVTLIGGEGEGAERRTAVMDKYNYVGLDRREIFTDARELSSKTEDGVLSEEEYTKQLEEKGAMLLDENTEDELFEGDLDYNSMYKYGVDYTVGDIVQLQTEYGVERSTRIVEFIRSKDVNGFSMYPTFKMEVEKK